MKKIVIMDGCSSFTGYWFAKELQKNKYLVIKLFNKKKEKYFGNYKLRVLDLKDNNSYFNIKFGSKSFLKLLTKYKNFIYIHHAAYTKDYDNDDNFNLIEAISENNYNIEKFFEILKEKNCKKIILSNSYYQKYGKYENLNKYALSKSITNDCFDYFSKKYNVILKKIMIASPFGPLEQKGLLKYVCEQILTNKIPSINNSHDKNDFIYIKKLSRELLKFIENSEANLNCGQYYLNNKEMIEIVSKEIEKVKKIKVEIKYKKNSYKIFDRKMKTRLKKSNKDINEYIKYYLSKIDERSS